MILLSSRKLEHALAAGKLEPWSKVKYLILPTVLASLSGPFYVIAPRFGEPLPLPNRVTSVVCSVLAAYITYWGIKRCFETNAEIDGKAFFERFTVLYVPPMMKLLLITLPLNMALVIVASAISENNPQVLMKVWLLMTLEGPLIWFATYTMLNNSFQRLGLLVEEPQ